MGRERRLAAAANGASAGLILLVPVAQSWGAPLLASRGWGHASGIATVYSWCAMGIVLGLQAARHRRFLGPLGRYMLGHLGQTAILAFLLLLCWGHVGVGLGIPNLIWDERPLGRIASAMGATLLLALLGINAYYLGGSPASGTSSREWNAFIVGVFRFLRRRPSRFSFGDWLRPSREGRRPDERNRRALSAFLRLGRLPFLTLASLPALFPRVFANVPWAAPRGGPGWAEGSVRAHADSYFFGLAVWGLGLLAGCLLVKLTLRFSAVMGDFREWMIRLPSGRVDWKGRWRAIARRGAWQANLSGFHQYLAAVLVVYAFLGLSASRLPMARGLALAMILVLGTLPLAVACALRLRARGAPAKTRRALLVDSRISVLVGLLAFTYGIVLYWMGRENVSAAFAIFALLGLLATAHAICARREFFLVRWGFAGVLAMLTAIVIARPLTGERVTAHDGLALVALGSVFAFGWIRDRLRSGDAPWPPLRATAAASLPFAAGIGLAWLVGLRIELPAVALASAFWGVASATMEPSRGAVNPTRDERNRWVLLTLAVGLWILLVNYDPFKTRFDALGVEYGEIAERGSPGWERLASKIKRIYPYDVLRASTAAKVPPAPVLLENREVLEAWRDVVAEPSTPGRVAMKPKLVVVCVSGGAIRSAYWSAAVLKRLEEGSGEEERSPAIRNFHEHVRLITGASGGMVGMSYYETALRDRASRPAGASAAPFDLRGIRPKSLNRVAGFIALQSFWRMFLPRLPGNAAYDRGRALEDDWGALRDVRFADLRELERQGRIPSLVFSPMIVDDGRRLLISNLDLAVHSRIPQPLADDDLVARRRVMNEWSIPVSRQDDLDNDNDGRTRNQFSISALELFKLIPGSDERLSLATAARMNATFPFVSPAVSLPTDPPLRVVDAAYYDNYGVHLAGVWLLQNRQWLLENTSGVLVVQTRDSVSKRARVGVPSESTGFFDRILRGARFLTSVGDAVLNARSSTNAFRNDQELVAVNEVFRGMGAGSAFVATAVFENTAYLSSFRPVPPRPGSGSEGDPNDPAMVAARPPWPGLDEAAIDSISEEVPMSWYITEDELRAIERAIPRPPSDVDHARILLNIGRHAAYFKDGGNYSPLRRALSFSEVFSSSESRIRGHDEYHLEDARRVHERFVGLATLLAAAGFDGPAERGTLRKTLDALGAELLLSPNADDEARDVHARFFSRDGDWRRVSSEADRLLLARVVSEALGDPAAGISSQRMKDVLLYAHSEWLNAESGLDSYADDADPRRRLHDEETHRLYHGREFERTMNYFRVRAIESWWRRDQSSPRGRREPADVAKSGLERKRPE